MIDGMTADQRFYLGWGQAWQEKTREAEIIRLVKIDPHSPPEFRANGPAVNQASFHNAFGTKPGDKEPAKLICASALAFGGDDARTLYITACDDVYAIRLKAPGRLQGPPR